MYARSLVWPPSPSSLLQGVLRGSDSRYKSTALILLLRLVYNSSPYLSLYQTINMTRFISVATVLAAISLARAQSADPGLGTNPNAQGATEVSKFPDSFVSKFGSSDEFYCGVCPEGKHYE